MVVGQPSQDICSFHHDFSKWHTYKVANSDLFISESENKGETTEDTINKGAERENTNTNKPTGKGLKGLMGLEDVPLAILAEEFEHPEDTSLAMFKAGLLKLDSQSENQKR